MLPSMNCNLLFACFHADDADDVIDSVRTLEMVVVNAQKDIQFTHLYCHHIIEIMDKRLVRADNSIHQQEDEDKKPK